MALPPEIDAAVRELAESFDLTPEEYLRKWAGRLVMEMREPEKGLSRFGVEAWELEIDPEYAALVAANEAESAAEEEELRAEGHAVPPFPPRPRGIKERDNPRTP